MYNSHVKHLKKASNLTRLQKLHINILCNNKDYIVLMSDKNLGPSIIEQKEYIKLALNEHLLQVETYTNLQKEEAYDFIDYMNT